jgi:hypothetical protein
MKRLQLFSLITLTVTLFAGSFVARAADSPDLVDTGTVRVEGANGTPLTNVHVHQEGETLLIWGMFSTSPLPGHVDVTVLMPDRKVIAETQVVPTVVRRGHPGGLLWRVDAKLSATPSRGAVVRIGYGFGHHDAAQTRAADETGK